MQDLYELHTHLEGSFPKELLATLISSKLGIDKQTALEEISARFRYKSFSEFIDAWYWKNSFLTSRDDIEKIAKAFAEKQRDQGIKYTELHISPPDFKHVTEAPSEYIQSVKNGLACCEGASVKLIIDLVRDYGPVAARGLYDALMEECAGDFVGVGLGGNEDSYPAREFEEIFTDARKNNLLCTVHAGETKKPENVRDALRHLKPHRIGHGIAAGCDETLLREIRDCDVALDICPTSNVRTGAIASIDAHPVKKIFDSGVPIVIGTDDSLMFENSLSGEFALLEAHCGFSRAEIAILMKNAIAYSYTSLLL